MADWTFGPYRVESLLGRGGMGEVYRAYDTSHDRVVALKLLAAHLTDDEGYRARFRRECHLAARLREPHVIPIHSFGEVDGRLFLDMRLVEGRDLGAAVADGPLPAAMAVDIISQVARALDAAHDDDLIHRDVKPSNVLMAEDATDSDPNFVFVYLVDFGVARGVGEDDKSVALTQAGSAVGTFDYMPPERFLGQPADRRTDVYSLACLLYECLTGSRPFVGTDLPTLMYAHMNRTPPSPSQVVSGLPSGLDAVVARGMAKDTNDRFPKAGDLAAAARTALADPGRTVRILQPNVPPPDIRRTPAPPTTTPPPAPSFPLPPSLPPPVSFPPPRTGSMSTPHPPPRAFASTPVPAPPAPPAGSSPPVPPASPPLTPWRPPAPAANTPPGQWQAPAGAGSSAPVPPWRPPAGPTGPGSGPNRSTKRPLVLALVASVLVVVLVVVIVLVTTGSKSPKAAPSTTASQSKDFPSTPAAGSSAPSATSSLSAGQATLVKSLPSSYTANDCVGEPVPSNFAATATLACGKGSSTPGPTTAAFFLYSTVDLLRADFSKLMTAQAVPQSTDQCPAIGYRGYHYDAQPTVTVGSMASYIEKDTTSGNGSAVIAWTIEPDLVLAIAINSGGQPTLANMCTWWTQN